MSKKKSTPCTISKRNWNKNNKLRIKWYAFVSRCQTESNKDYHRYGGRGIKVCDSWCDFYNFEKWALNNGYKEGLEIDRIDNDGNYDPSNCRFATRAENARNRRDCKLKHSDVLEIRDLYKNRIFNQQKISEIYGVSRPLISRISANKTWVM